MKHLAAALVTSTLIVASIIGDMGYMNDNDGAAWDIVATCALIAFVLQSRKNDTQ